MALASSQPGPNAPLGDACNTSSQPEASAQAGHNAWTTAGFPASQIVLGVPSYGYLSTSTATRLRTRRASSQTIRLSSDGDQIQFRDLVSQGALLPVNSTRDKYGTMFNGTGGFVRKWDNCSSTPYLRSSSAGQVVAYDDVESVGMKAAYAKQVGMVGVNMFDVHGDTDGCDLTDAIRRGLGLLS